MNYPAFVMINIHSPLFDTLQFSYQLGAEL